MTTVAIPFVRTEASQNPNLRVRDGGDPAEPYMRAMTVAFASVRRWNPDADLHLISNAAPEEDHHRELRRLGVEYKLVPFAHRPPVGFAARFEASLYLLDALGSLEADTTLLIDPDVLCVNSMDALLSHVADHAAALDMQFPEDEDINGLTRTQAAALHAALGESVTLPLHYGGEAYVVPLALAPAIMARCESAWTLALSRNLEGLTKFTTEEHVLSYALRGVPLKTLNDHIRRIWTTHTFRQVDGLEGQLTLWHLPAEKDRGFNALYGPATDFGSWFWLADRGEFLDRCGRAMGFHHRTPSRLAKDIAGSVVSRARHLGACRRAHP
ncbi:hypothetical protein [Arthrobacter sp. PsM3]|uniref:hypothetical protein n=1 Tax=Arthrobacter sp. PsM3 TaxID=3030531 RepID=UPI00263B3504|nr:hypothetical protein [Arthrobacter sp. PsM3]MDN4646384.1 hypothetical protein [Arthrobacter sp. PsM3]